MALGSKVPGSKLPSLPWPRWPGGRSGPWARVLSERGQGSSCGGLYGLSRASGPDSFLGLLYVVHGCRYVVYVLWRIACSARGLGISPALRLLEHTRTQQASANSALEELTETMEPRI